MRDESILVLELNKNLAALDFTLLWINGKECTKSESTKVIRFVWSTSSSCMKLYTFAKQICTLLI